MSNCCYLCYMNLYLGGGVADGLGDGAMSEENIKVGSTHVRYYDRTQCNAK